MNARSRSRSEESELGAGSRSVIKIDCVKLAALDLAMLLWRREQEMAVLRLTSSLQI